MEKQPWEKNSLHEYSCLPLSHLPLSLESRAWAGAEPAGEVKVVIEFYGFISSQELGVLSCMLGGGLLLHLGAAHSLCSMWAEPVRAQAAQPQTGRLWYYNRSYVQPVRSISEQ